MRLFTLLQTAFTQIGNDTAQITKNTNSIKKISSACSARGNTSSLSLTATVKTIVPLNTWITRTNTEFTFSGNGIKCPYAGTVMVSGSVYMSGGTNISCGCYILKNGNETINQYIQTVAGGVSAGTGIIPVSAGDIITLVARRSSAGTCVPNNETTHLSIVYID